MYPFRREVWLGEVSTGSFVDSEDLPSLLWTCFSNSRFLFLSWYFLLSFFNFALGLDHLGFRIVSEPSALRRLNGFVFDMVVIDADCEDNL